MPGYRLRSWWSLTAYGRGFKGLTSQEALCHYHLQCDGCQRGHDFFIVGAETRILPRWLPDGQFQGHIAEEKNSRDRLLVIASTCTCLPDKPCIPSLPSQCRAKSGRGNRCTPSCWRQITTASCHVARYGIDPHRTTACRTQPVEPKQRTSRRPALLRDLRA